MKFKKILLPISTSALLMVAGVNVVACANTKHKTIKTTSPVDSWLESNSWVSYVMSNSETGITLNIPKMYSAEDNEKKSEQAFNTSSASKSQLFEVPYKDLLSKTKAEISKEIVKRLYDINKKISTIIKDPKNKSEKFVAYFYQDKKPNTLSISVRQLKPITSGVQDILDMFADESDINDPTSGFSTFHGHPLWSKNWIVSKENGNLIFNAPYSQMSKYLTALHKPMNDNKLRIKDKANPNKTFSMDPRMDATISKMPNTTPQEIKDKNDAMLKWLKDKVDNYFLNKNALLNSYPYIDYSTNQVKVMLISADKGATIKSITGYKGFGWPPDIMVNAKEISYKTVTLNGIIPSTNANQTTTPAIDNDIVKIMQGIFEWLAVNNGPTSVQDVFSNLKTPIPLLQSLFTNIFPLFNKLREDYETLGRFQSWEMDIKDIDVYKNLDSIKSKLSQALIDSKFDLSKISKLKQNIWGPNLNDPNQPPTFKSWGPSTLIDLNATNQHYFMDMFWMLKSIVKGFK